MLAVYDVGDKPVPGYQLLRFLGRGGFGQVWKARAPGGTEVALKLIDLQGHQGFKEFRAIRLVKRIRHPNLAPTLAYWLTDQTGKLLEDVGEEDSGDFTKSKPAELIMAMGLGDKNLLDRLEECKKEKQPGVPVQELLKYMEAAADAIDFLNSPSHDLGQGPVAIQHGDIKPQNMLMVGGAAQVCDFGLASVLGDARSTNPTASFAYVAPETLDNQPGKWTDQYSLAISYYELRTGVLPFPAGNMPMILRCHAEGKLDLSKLPPGEQAVIRRATDLMPNMRYPTTAEMVKALRRAVEGTRGPSMVTPGPDGQLRLQPGLELVPGYRLVQFLGGGSYGKVWEAAAPGDIHVALKIIEHLSAASGRQEFKALELIKRVEHSHLMDLLAYWLLDETGQVLSEEDRDREDGPQPATLIIACKLARKNLAQRLKECLTATGQGIPPLELLRYMRQAAKAIDHLNMPQHRLDDDKVVSIQHRDIKPENILLAGDAVKVADFGLAKIVEGTTAHVHTGSAGLTLAYAAPEMFENKITQWTDQYCLAITYYHLRTGTLPFDSASSPNEIISAHLFGKLDLNRLPEPERKAIARATSTLPELRYPNCVEMVEALYQAAFGAMNEDDSFMLERAAEAAAASGVYATPAPPRPVSGSTPTQSVVPDGLLGSLAAPVSIAQPPRRLKPRDDDTMSEGTAGTLHPGKLQKLPEGPGPTRKSSRAKWLVLAVLAVVSMAGGIVVAVTMRGGGKSQGTSLAGGGQPSVGPGKSTEDSTPSIGPRQTMPTGPPGQDTKPTPVAGLDVPATLQRGQELLNSAPQAQEALDTFTKVLNSSSSNSQQRRSALLGQARAAARLDRQKDVVQALAELNSKQFQDLGPLPAADAANFAALELLQNGRGLPPESLFKSLVNFNGAYRPNDLGKWEQVEIGKTADDVIEKITPTISEKTPAQAGTLAINMLDLRDKLPIGVYQAVAESVRKQRQPPAASTEADIDSQSKDVLEFFAKARVEDKDKDRVRELERDVLAKDIEWRCPFAQGGTDYWRGRLAKCEKAAVTGWTLACRAEARVETNSSDLVSARTEAFNPKVEAIGDYGKYVRGRVCFAERESAEALKQLLEIDAQSSWLIPGKDGPKYRGRRAAEILLSEIGTINQSLSTADKLRTNDSKYLKPETLENVFKTLQPAIQRVVRARSFDAEYATQKLRELDVLMKSFVPGLRQLADKALKKAQQTPTEDEKQRALECVQGFKVFGGDPIEAARLLGEVYEVREEWVAALRAFDEGLPRNPNAPSQFDLESLESKHYLLLMERTRLIVQHDRDFPPGQLPPPEGIFGPADKAADLAPDDQKGEANGTAGWAYHCAAELWKQDQAKTKLVGTWRKTAIDRLLKALPNDVKTANKQRSHYYWLQLLGIQVKELLADKVTAAIGESYRETALKKLSDAVKDKSTPKEFYDDFQELLEDLKKK